MKDMKTRTLRALSLLAALLLAPGAQAQDVIEKVVVRNRLHTLKGRYELGLSTGFTLMSRLTDHINFTGNVAYNTSEWFGFELRGGYAYTRHTGLARDVADAFSQNSSVQTANDLTDLWELQGNLAVGARWAPIYGKISLMSEVPLHFQTYLWMGAGAGTFRRESVVYCTQGTATACDAFLTEDKIGPFAAAALGFRFFANVNHSLKLELRDYSFPDSYRENIVRADARVGRDTGTPASSPGITNLVQIDVGYAYIF